MARFADTQTSQSEAINTLADELHTQSQGTKTARTAGAGTLTAAEVINGVVEQSGSNGAVAVLFPTASAIVAAIANCQIGSTFEFAYVNNNDNTVTLTTNTGLTLTGTMAVPTTKTQLFKGYVTAVSTPAVAIAGLLVAPV